MLRRVLGLVALAGCTTPTPAPTQSTAVPTVSLPLPASSTSTAPSAAPSTSGSAPADTSAGFALPADLEITLERSACYGVCPAYVVTLRADGTVEYRGDKYVRVHGSKVDRVKPNEVRALLIKMDRAGFDGLTVPDPCDKGISTDHATHRLTLVRNGKRRTIVHYTGNLCAPPALGELADEIDRVAGTDRWTRCGKGSGVDAFCDKP